MKTIDRNRKVNPNLAPMPTPSVDALRTPEVLECAQRLREFRRIEAEFDFNADSMGWMQVHLSVVNAERMLNEAISRAFKNAGR